MPRVIIFAQRLGAAELAGARATAPRTVRRDVPKAQSSRAPRRPCPHRRARLACAAAAARFQTADGMCLGAELPRLVHRFCRCPRSVGGAAQPGARASGTRTARRPGAVAAALCPRRRRQPARGTRRRAALRRGARRCGARALCGGAGRRTPGALHVPGAVEARLWMGLVVLEAAAVGAGACGALRQA
jgi:hypothetical protein